MGRIAPLQYPPDAVLLTGARERWLREQQRESLGAARDQLADVHTRLQRVDLREDVKAFESVQAVISGAALLREHVQRHIAASEALRQLAGETSSEMLDV